MLGVTINYRKQFKELADRMATEPTAEWALDRERPRDLADVEAWRHDGQQSWHEGSRSTRSLSTLTTVGATPHAPIRCRRSFEDAALKQRGGSRARCLTNPASAPT